MLGSLSLTAPVRGGGCVHQLVLIGESDIAYSQLRLRIVSQGKFNSVINCLSESEDSVFAYSTKIRKLTRNWQNLILVTPSDAARM